MNTIHPFSFPITDNFIRTLSIRAITDAPPELSLNHPIAVMPNDRDKILLVEDELGIVETLVPILKEAGFEVVHRQTFYGCGEEMRLDPLPALILLDLGLPDSQPYETINNLSILKEYEVPIVVLTGHGDKTIKKAAIARGATDYVEKPILDLFALIDRVGRIIREDKTDKALKAASEHAAAAAHAVKTLMLSNGLTNGNGK